jgi:hypothetical protein
MTKRHYKEDNSVANNSPYTGHQSSGPLAGKNSINSEPHKPMIDIHNITAYQQETRGFDGFSLHIGAHERMAILGPTAQARARC